MSEEDSGEGRHKYIGVAVIGAIAVLILVSFTGVSSFSGSHKLELKAHFQNAQGLRAGAPVRLAGVDIGLVKSVQVRPEWKDKPVEVVMSLRTSNELRLPTDSVVLLSTAGVLGETFIDIDTRTASGPPLKDGGELPTREAEHVSAAELIERFGAAIKQIPCEQADQNETKKPVKK